jgi:outer membrane biosynthesis protein TonB
MKYTLAVILLFCFRVAVSQTDTTTYGYINGTLIETEMRPAFFGGIMAWKRFLSKNLEQQSTAGKETIEFLVNVDGTTSNYVVINPINPDLDDEAKRLVKKSGIWMPAIQNGKKVKYRTRVEFQFP